MIRGIISPWKQIIFYDFDRKMILELLINMIVCVESVGFQIHGCVCDMGGANHSLLNQLGIDEKTTYFSNPFASNRFVHVFLDIPHLIKLGRNHLLDHGFQKQKKMFITCFSIKELLSVDGFFETGAQNYSRAFRCQGISATKSKICRSTAVRQCC